jgi:signal peptidase I
MKDRILETNLDKSVQERAASTPKPRSRGGFREWVGFLVTLVIMVFFIRVTTVEAFRIPTGSMENTLLVGDFLLVNKFIYGFVHRIGSAFPLRISVSRFHPIVFPDRERFNREISSFLSIRSIAV